MVITTIITIIIAFITALAPAFIWFILFSKKDVHPEPKRLIIYTFNFGVMISLVVLAFQIIFRSMTAIPIDNMMNIISLALIEEVFKFLSAFWAIHKDPEFNEPIDAVIYTMAAALGFATVENFFTDLVVSSPLILKTISFRFIGATLLHVLASAIVGYYWANGRKNNSLIKSIMLGLVIATIVHSIFNLLIYKFHVISLWYWGLFLVIAVFFISIDFNKLKNEKSFDSL